MITGVRLRRSHRRFHVHIQDDTIRWIRWLDSSHTHMLGVIQSQPLQEELSGPTKSLPRSAQRKEQLPSNRSNASPSPRLLALLQSRSTRESADIHQSTYIDRVISFSQHYAQTLMLIDSVTRAISSHAVLAIFPGTVPELVLAPPLNMQDVIALRHLLLITV